MQVTVTTYKTAPLHRARILELNTVMFHSFPPEDYFTLMFHSPPPPEDYFTLTFHFSPLRLLHTNVPFLPPLKRFSDIFRGYDNGPLSRNRLLSIKYPAQIMLANRVLIVSGQSPKN